MRESARCHNMSRCGRTPPLTSKDFGASSPASCTGSSPIKRSWSGTSRLPSGSSAARPTSPIIAWTSISTRRWPSGRRIVWEGEAGDARTFTYRTLHAEVCKFANVLRGLGIGRGDVVAIYLPMVPELAIAMLACAGSARFIAWSSPGFRPRRSPTATTMRAPNSDHGRGDLASRPADCLERSGGRRVGPLAHGRKVHRAAPN